jgi:hypothetical protein
MLLSKSLLGALLAITLLGHLPAQNCGANSTLLKNDILPDNPSGALQVAVVPGLCVGEAAMSVFDAGGPVTVESVSIAFVNRFATNGIQAVVDVEIYDGATLNSAGRYTLGPQLFKLSSGSSNLQIRSSGINEYRLPVPVRVPSGKPVIGFRMLQTLAGGSCLLGYDTNFATDAQYTKTPGRNILDATGHGPIDPTLYMGFGVPLYPIYFRGDWVIRACVKTETSVTWTGNATPGGFLSLTYNAPGQSGDQYFALVSGGVATGFGTPWGKMPLDFDPIFSCYLGGCRNTLLNSIGTFNAQGKAFGALQIPSLPWLANSGLTLHVGFVTFDNQGFFPWKSISSPSKPIVIR